MTFYMYYMGVDRIARVKIRGTCKKTVFHAPLVRSEIITCCDNTILLVSSLLVSSLSA